MPRHHHRHSLEKLLQRDAPSIANEPSLLDRKTQQTTRERIRSTPLRAQDSRARLTSQLSETEDRRRFHPEAAKPPRTKRGAFAKYAPAAVSSPKARNASSAEPRRGSIRFSAFRPSAVAVGVPRRSMQEHLPSRLSFKSAKHVWVCVKRKMRKEVIHALKLAGHRGGRTRQPRRNMYSDIVC